MKAWLSFLAGLLFSGIAISAHAAIDLRNASVETLDNGLTLILLEDRRFPVVSVQMLYRVGARDEVSGKTGLAHFLEHMAFRDSENFPGTDLVSRIYAAGGEWHGYTWIDQTTYFATAPREDLDLLLRIEADRMERLKIAEEHMRPERGAVLAEMHMYENSPASLLIDAVNYTTFLAHPYRNNTIGWESDIENLQHRDVVAFYEQHYHPANAVIAVVGDFDEGKARALLTELFGLIPEKAATPLPHTVEPPQDGVRRVMLHGNSEQRQFMMAYRAPAAGHSNFAAFLVLQEVIGTGSGVNFLQNDWGTPVDSNSVLSGAAESLTTWFPPSAQDYVFMIGGSAPVGDSESVVEQRIESRLAPTRQQTISDAALKDAISDVQDALIFDVETTEDAAHQLAFFDGLQALDTLLTLPERVAAVTASDVQRVAATYLLPEKRSIAWYLPHKESAPVVVAPRNPAHTVLRERPLEAPGTQAIKPPVVTSLSGGTPVILQRSDLSSTTQIQVVLSSNRVDGARSDEPIAGYSSMTYATRPQQLGNAIARAREAVSALTIERHSDRTQSTDPATRLEYEFAAIMYTDNGANKIQKAPALIVVTGDLDVRTVLHQLEDAFGDLAYKQYAGTHPGTFSSDDLVVNVGTPVAQAQLGYIVPAPPPGDSQSDAFRLLLYIFSHGYEGRLGKKAISDSGLAYYIDGQYRSDGGNAWITLSTGVDRDKVAPLRTLVSSELKRLASEPPTNAEIAEAKNHMLGRLRSSAQSNAELSTELATQWLWYGETLTVESFRDRLDAISQQDVLSAIASFTAGKTIIVAE